MLATKTIGFGVAAICAAFVALCSGSAAPDGGRPGGGVSRLSEGELRSAVGATLYPCCKQYGDTASCSQTSGGPPTTACQRDNIWGGCKNAGVMCAVSGGDTAHPAPNDACKNLHSSPSATCADPGDFKNGGCIQYTRHNCTSHPTQQQDCTCDQTTSTYWDGVRRYCYDPAGGNTAWICP
jgi:hypothetical protein